jgi:hypothetical protein
MDRKLFAMKGFHHPGGSQSAFLTGLAHRYNLIPYQRRAKNAGLRGVEVEGGRVPTSDWMLSLQILTSGGYQYAPDPPNHSIGWNVGRLNLVSRSPKQDAKPFLGEMTVVGEDIDKPFAPHRLHANTVRQAIMLVQTRFAKVKPAHERFMGLGNDRNVVICQYGPGKAGGPSSGTRTTLAEKREKFSENFLRRDQLIIRKLTAEGPHPFMPLISLIAKGNPVKGIRKEIVHSGRFGVL